ncbi:LysR family cys regulon transcriptional activator [Trinickia symbiotica]|uniref:HTH lysR-type domain-containing protein n=1 Tax=Trinickia symbiotica TaxID=863227 RepID=A0A2N7WL26_9BURK|nr:LysR substrate-binding domain-containing protein [Trinickia symbiotica]PMS30107.1 hypothetical protein C0Z20_30350 [Trinickia symbiotica]PPK41101.1 LysR family cys regulon transcriptional activator [Trinickia symbiotica]
MKLRQLQCLCAVVDAGLNISRAATVLHATQPAVAKQLKQFEEELGVDLLLRRGDRPVELTSAGARVVAWARRALQAVDNFTAIAQENNGEEGGTITLATSHAHANYLLLHAIAAFNQRFPRVRMQVVQALPYHVAELVRDGKAAVGVTYMPWQVPRDVVAVPFMTTLRLVVASAGHPLLQEAELTLERLAAYPLIVPQSARPQGAYIVSRFRQAGLEVNPIVQAYDVDVTKTYVAAGLGVGIIPAFCFSAEKDAGLEVRDVGHLFEPVTSVVLARRHGHLSPYVYVFLQAIDVSLERRRLETLILEDS